MSIVIKKERQIRSMRQAGEVVARVLELMEHSVEPGMTTMELDKLAEKETRALGAKPSFKGYRGFPACVCISLNEQIVHGIPGERIIQAGDIVSLDYGAIVDGYNADAAVTVAVGNAGSRAQNLISATREALAAGIEAARPGGRLGDISAAVQRRAEAGGYGIIREYSGHGVGKALHEDPLVPNYGQPGSGPELQNGMTLAIEPMLTLGGWRTKVGPDNWVVSTADGTLSAHYEHTVLITDGGAEILTAVQQRVGNG